MLFGLIHTQASSLYTPYALDSFFECTPLRDDDQLILIENDSSTVETARFGSRVQVLRSERPQSFAENGNILIQQALKRSTDLVFMNNDLYFTPGWLEPILADSESILSPLSNRELQYTLDPLKTAVSMELTDLLPHLTLLPKIVEIHRQRSQGYMRVLILPFFCVRIPLAALHAIGSFDTDFGKGGAEDYDYCLRAVLSDIPVKYALNSYIIHFGGKSTWSGAETAEQQRNREERFHHVFREKWGERLWQLALGVESEASLTLDDFPELKEGRYKELAMRLAPSPLPPLRR